MFRVLALILGLVAMLPAVSLAQARKPNIVVIMAKMSACGSSIARRALLSRWAWS
jgi:hypothetical protein